MLPSSLQQMAATGSEQPSCGEKEGGDGRPRKQRRRCGPSEETEEEEEEGAKEEEDGGGSSEEDPPSDDSGRCPGAAPTSLLPRRAAPRCHGPVARTGSLPGRACSSGVIRRQGQQTSPAAAALPSTPNSLPQLRRLRPAADASACGGQPRRHPRIGGDCWARLPTALCTATPPAWTPCCCC